MYILQFGALERGGTKALANALQHLRIGGTLPLGGLYGVSLVVGLVGKVFYCELRFN